MAGIAERPRVCTITATSKSAANRVLRQSIRYAEIIAVHTLPVRRGCACSAVVRQRTDDYGASGSRIESRCGSSRCRSPRADVRQAGNEGSSWVRKGGSRP
jgi:hypothetical protein